MKFTCKKNKLKDAISKIERVVSKQTTLPILGNILIKTEKGQLILMATNLEIAIKVYISAKIEDNGSVTIPPRILSGFLNNIKDDVVKSEVIDNKFFIKSENHNIQIKTLSAKDFPIIPEMPESYYFKMKTENIIKAVNSVNISVAHKDTRQELNGVYAEFQKEGLILASTDSFRLTEIKIPLIKESINNEYNDFIEKDNNIILPIGIITEIQQLSLDGEIDVFVNENQIFINTENIQITSQLINGHYPDYKQIIPTDCEIKIKLNKDELLDAIKIAALVTNSQNGEIKISKNKEDNFITITAQSVDLGENVSTVKIEKNDNEFEIYFNHRYLIEGLSSVLFNNDIIQIEFKQEKSPALFRNIYKGEPVKSFVYMIMPIIKD
jgi:DNA polymerase-3 subunit beta